MFIRLGECYSVRLHMIEYDFPLVQMLLEVGFEFLEKKES